MDENDRRGGFAGISDLISTVEDKKASTTDPSPKFSEHQTPSVPESPELGLKKNIRESQGDQSLSPERAQKGSVTERKESIDKSGARNWIIGFICFAILLIIIGLSSKSNDQPKQSSANTDRPSNVPESSATPPAQNPAPAAQPSVQVPVPPPAQSSVRVPVPPRVSRSVARERDQDVTLGRYMCSQYHHNFAQALKPSPDEKQRIEKLKTKVSLENDTLESLEDHLRLMDRSSEYYNEQVMEFNSLVNIYRTDVAELKRRIAHYNDKISSYNSYLTENCKPR